MTDLIPDRTRTLRRLSWCGAAFAFGLIVLGGIVRITGSGMGCGDHWPRCNGEWFPPLDLPTLIEIGHRWMAALVSALVLAIAAVAWLRHRRDDGLRAAPTLALVLLVAQVLLGAVTVKLELPPWVVITHFVNAMFLLGALVVSALRATPSEAVERPAQRHAAHGLAHGVAGLGFLVIFFGGLVANFHAGLVCQGFPLCNGSVIPPMNAQGWVHWTHRVLAFTFAALAVVLFRRTRGRSDEAGARLHRAAGWVLAATLVQIAVAAGMVLHFLPPSLRALHLLVGAALWVALIVLVFRSGRTAEKAETDAAPAADTPTPGLAADLVTLTKPRIISLLLVTTVAPMFITERGLPSAALVAWVIVAGYLMAGGANAINMWFDRDVDVKMARTRLRPIPAGRIAPAAGLAFGVGLGAVSFAMFWTLVNPLSAWLALGGLLFYVLVYTAWLKRSSPQNIVIGGAAGAFPPLVGWAAVANEIDLAAIYLFAIVFYWTPPHFWALALVKRGDYERAGIPMLPVVRGEERTKFEMLVYTLLLLPLTIMPAVFGAMGWVYGIAAALLGARLLWYCVTLLRERGTTPTAWRMYRYSLLYLALLFLAMGVDRALPLGAREEPAKVIILDRPDEGLVTPVVGHTDH